jgi:SAM-dependent methyltransferase
MTRRSAEAWRHPLFAPPTTWLQRFAAACRRFLDLQAESIWRDLSHLLPQCDGTLVDVGCGAQPYRRLLSDRATYIGIDTAQAKAHFGYEMPDTIYFDGDQWPLEDASIDVVLSTETLEHVADTPRFLSELVRVLRRGGSVILTVPFAARYHFIPYDYWRFTPASLQRLLNDAGLENVAVYARGNAVTVACYKAMALMLPLLFAASRSTILRIVRVACGLVSVPLILLLATIAQVSLRFDGGDDCLGYTVLAQRF